MKKSIMTLILLIATIVTCTVVLCACTSKGPQTLDGSGMINPNAIRTISYYKGGSDIGDSYTITLEENKIEFDKCEGNGMPHKKRTAKLTDKMYVEICNWADTNDVRSWVNLDKTDLVALDAPSTSLRIEFYDGVEISVGSGDLLPEGGGKAYSELISLLESAK